VAGGAGDRIASLRGRSGTPILVIHGGPGFPPAGRGRGSAAGAGYRLIYYHQRGCGLSSRPIKRFSGSNMYANMQLLNRTLGLPAQVADIERIRRILGVDKIVLMGHSFGAFLAALYAAEFPEHVARVDLRGAGRSDGSAQPAGRPVRRGAAAPASGDEAGIRELHGEYFDFRRASSAARANRARSTGGSPSFTERRRAGGCRRRAMSRRPATSRWRFTAAWGSTTITRRRCARSRRRSRDPWKPRHAAGEREPRIRCALPQLPICANRRASHFVFEDRPEEFAARRGSF